MSFVIAQPCIGVKDSSCVAVCPVDCIHGDHSSEQYVIDPVACIDCALCVDACPVEAIFALDDLPKKWRHYASINAEATQRTAAAETGN